jgi:hypothetical protein
VAMISSEQNKSLEHKNDDVRRLNLMSELCVPYMSDQLSEISVKKRRKRWHTVT